MHELGAWPASPSSRPSQHRIPASGRVSSPRRARLTRRLAPIPSNAPVHGCGRATRRSKEDRRRIGLRSRLNGRRPRTPTRSWVGSSTGRATRALRASLRAAVFVARPRASGHLRRHPTPRLAFVCTTRLLTTRQLLPLSLPLLGYPWTLPLPDNTASHIGCPFRRLRLRCLPRVTPPDLSSYRRRRLCRASLTRSI